MNIFDKIKKIRDEKRAFRAYRRRVEALPKEYRVIFSEIEAYFWNFAMDGMIDVLSDIVTLFETGAAEGKRVSEITGEDVLGFCDGLLQEWMSRTWTGQLREKFNARIQKKLAELKSEELKNGE
jgi:DNA-binding ferritin-like protein (Dps family)